jgi:hypothetical protein
MKEVIIIATYCNTIEKLNALEDTITRSKSMGFDVIVYGKYPIPERLQLLCDFWIFDKQNTIMTDRAVVIWENRFGKTATKIAKNDWGYAVFEQIKRSLACAKSLNYDVAYWLNYDIDMTYFFNFYKICNENIKNYDSIFYGWDKDTNNGVALTSMCFKINETYDKINGLLNEKSYKKISSNTNMLAEHIFENLLQLTDLNFYKITNSTPLLTKIWSFSNRTNGFIPEEFSKTLKYFQKCNVARNTDIDKIVIFISFIKVELTELMLDLGTQIITVPNPRTNEFNCIEIVLENPLPTKFKIISINNEEINETLDEYLDSEHFESNTIRNSN